MPAQRAEGRPRRRRPRPEGSSEAAGRPLRCDPAPPPMPGPRLPARAEARRAQALGHPALPLLLPPLLLLAAAPSGRAGRWVAHGHCQVRDADAAGTAQRGPAPSRQLGFAFPRAEREARGLRREPQGETHQLTATPNAPASASFAPPGVSHGPLRGLQWGAGGLTMVAQTGTHSSERAVRECDRAPCSQLHVAGSRHPCSGRAEKPCLAYALRPTRPVALSQGTPCS